MLSTHDEQMTDGYALSLLPLAYTLSFDVLLMSIPYRLALINILLKPGINFNVRKKLPTASSPLIINVFGIGEGSIIPK